MKLRPLPDILPKLNEQLLMLIIGKSPAPLSACLGHYFMGVHGKRFWALLNEYTHFDSSRCEFPDQALLESGFGITDVAKAPRAFGIEPTRDEYNKGFQRIQEILDTHEPQIILFVYKKPLDLWLKWLRLSEIGARYGFNSKLGTVFKPKVFVSPLPGVGQCKTDDITHDWSLLRTALKKLKNSS